jgi:hypothetical protein
MWYQSVQPWNQHGVSRHYNRSMRRPATYKTADSPSSTLPSTLTNIFLCPKFIIHDLHVDWSLRLCSKNRDTMHLCPELRVRKAKAKEMIIFGAPLVFNKLSRLPAIDLKPRERLRLCCRWRVQKDKGGRLWDLEQFTSSKNCVKYLRCVPKTWGKWLHVVARVFEKTLLTLISVLEWLSFSKNIESKRMIIQKQNSQIPGSN